MNELQAIAYANPMERADKPPGSLPLMTSPDGRWAIALSVNK